MRQKDDDAFDENSINEIFRIMHTIKGSSGVMMYDNIMKVSHKLEDIFYYLRENVGIKRAAHGAYRHCFSGVGLYQRRDGEDQRWK